MLYLKEISLRCYWLTEQFPASEARFRVNHGEGRSGHSISMALLRGVSASTYIYAALKRQKKSLEDFLSGYAPLFPFTGNLL
jgi:hypothetical protein